MSECLPNLPAHFMDVQDSLRLLDRGREALRDDAVQRYLSEPEVMLDHFLRMNPARIGPNDLAALHVLESLKQRYGANPAFIAAQVQRYARLLQRFSRAYGRGPAMLVVCPARIELCGGHIDYVDYFQSKVLAFASRERDMVMAARPRRDRLIRAQSLQDGFPPAQFALDEFPLLPSRRPDDATEKNRAWLEYLGTLGCREHDWTNYVKAAAFYLQHVLAGNRLNGMDLVVDSTIPVAGGASSSSALVMAVGLGLRAANGIAADREELAEAGAKSEWYVGTRGGMMDHAAMGFGRAHHALTITFSPFKVSRAPVPTSAYEWITFYTTGAEKSPDLMALDNEISAVSTTILPVLIKRLLDEHPAYREPWQQMLKAIEEEDLDALAESQSKLEPFVARLPQAVTLTEVQDPSGDLAEVLRARYPSLYATKRAEHPLAVRSKAEFHFGEICRVLAESAALRAATAAQVRGDPTEEAEQMRKLGALMNATHEGLKTLYGVSTQDIERVVEILRPCEGVVGCRLMGFGCGGNVLALVHSSHAESAIQSVQEGYYRPRGRDGLQEDAILRHSPGPGIQVQDMAQSARTRLVALANDWRRWEENEREIMALALGLLGHKSLADFVPRKPIKPVILAGGKGTRAGLPGAKVLARIRGMPAIEWVLHTLESIPRMRPAILIVSNYQDSDREIRASLDGQYDVEYLVETELLGTGHAVLQAERLVAPFDGTVLVTEGTQALLRRETVLKSLLIHEAVGYAAMTLPTTRRERPYAYLVRDREGYVVDSRETRLEQAEIVDYGEDNVSVYLIGSAHLFPALHLARERSLDPKTHQYRLGQLGFPNEMARSLHQQQKLVLGLCFADVREAQSIKAAEDALRVERYMAELNGES